MSNPFPDFPALRRRMVQEQLIDRGIADRAVLHAFATVPREHFVPEPYRDQAYRDRPLPIPAGQTISQPYVVAWMMSLLDLQPVDRVLEIGAGSGYAAALLGAIVNEVVTVERHPVLAAYARERLADLGLDNVLVVEGDGTQGWPDRAPYDAIIVAAGGPAVPPALKEQLAVNGRLIMPVGKQQRRQRLVRVVQEADGRFRRQSFGAVAFVPLIGAEGWEDE